MANKKISELTALTGVSSGDTLVVVSNGTTYKFPVSGLSNVYAINNVGEANHHAVYDGNGFYKISEISEPLSAAYGTRSVYIGDLYESHYDPENVDKLGIYAGEWNSFNLISAHGSIDDYLQLNVTNFNSGTTASGDIVITANNGDENNYYVNLGINSSQYTGTSFVGAANDSYLYSNSNDFYIGNVVPGREIIIFNGGFNAAQNAKIFIHDNGTIGVNTDTNDSVNPASLRVFAPNSETFNLAYFRGEVDYYSQINVQNASNGLTASTDIVATNDIGTETSYYVDMGINSSNHIVDPDYSTGGPNDTYMLSVANNHYIGSSTSGKITLFTGPNFNGETNAKLVLTTTGNTINGNTSFSGNIVSQTVLSANYVNDAAAAVGGIPVGGLYHTNGAVKIRMV